MCSAEWCILNWVLFLFAAIYTAAEGLKVGFTCSPRIDWVTTGISDKSVESSFFAHVA